MKITIDGEEYNFEEIVVDLNEFRDSTKPDRRGRPRKLIIKK